MDMEAPRMAAKRHTRLGLAAIVLAPGLFFQKQLKLLAVHTIFWPEVTQIACCKQSVLQGKR